MTNRGDLEGMLKIAKKSAKNTNTNRYLFATAYGYAVAKQPVKWQSYFEITPEGNITFVEHKITCLV